jgi:glutathionylspermidine synthase
MKLPWHSVKPVEAQAFAGIRRAAIFECCKWDPQVGDICALSEQPIVLTREAWRELTDLAERLAAETLAAETAILQQRIRLRELALSWSLRRRFADPALVDGPARHLRLIRFDFHFTTEGWRISEANSDVPGGFNEASGFTRMIGEQYRGVSLAGDPTAELARAIRQRVDPGGIVALVHATSFTDDRQVMVYLKRHLEALDLKPVLIAPDHLQWDRGRAFLVMNQEPVQFIFRFFPAEWLPALPRRCAWWHLLGSSQTPLCNTGTALLSQSKRFPLVWDKLDVALPAWRELLPPTFDPRTNSKHLNGNQRVLKPAFGRVGDSISIPGVIPENDARTIEKFAHHHPRFWVAQQRFEAVPMQTAQGNYYPCIRVYTLDGRVIGAYGRIALRPLIDHHAQDSAVLIAAAPPEVEREFVTSHEPERTLQAVGA